MKKLVILSALALVFTGAAYARDGGAGGNRGAAGAPNSSYGQSTSGTAKAGDMDGKMQSDTAHMTHKKDAGDHGKHMGTMKGKHMGAKKEMKEGDDKK